MPDTKVLGWTDGQPFLTQKLCQLIRNHPLSVPIRSESEWVEDLVRTHVIHQWETQDEPEHLRTIRDRLLNLSTQPIECLKLYPRILEQGKGKIKGEGSIGVSGRY